MDLAGTHRIRLIGSDWFIIVSNLSHQKGIKRDAAYIYTALPGGHISFLAIHRYLTAHAVNQSDPDQTFHFSPQHGE